MRHSTITWSLHQCRISHEPTANEDYMVPPLSSNFVFNSNTEVGDSQCVTFGIVYDEIVEMNETYSVQLRQVPSVEFSESLTTVMIQDDDCKPLKKTFVAIGGIEHFITQHYFCPFQLRQLF